MKRVLVPTDFSENANKAIDYALNICRATNSELHLLTTYELPYSDSGLVLEVNEHLEKSAQDKMDQTLTRLREGNNDISISGKVIMGTLVNRLRNYAEESNISLIVMGTKGATGLKESLIGSNTADVIKSVDVPVLAVPEKAKFKPIQKLVFATDLKDTSEGLPMEQLVSFALHFKAEVVVLHVQEKEEDVSMDELITEMELERSLEPLQHKFQIIKGKDVEESILKYIKAENADLLAVVSHHRSFFKRIFHKSVSEELAFHTTVPMLALHTSAE